jgi:hypothetical protein
MKLKPSFLSYPYWNFKGLLRGVVTYIMDKTWTMVSDYVCLNLRPDIWLWPRHFIAPWLRFSTYKMGLTKLKIKYN